MENYVRANFTNGAWRRRSWLIIFPEGGFKYKRLTNSRRFAEKNNLPSGWSMFFRDALLHFLTKRKY